MQDKRIKKMIALFRSGCTLREIGALYNLSRERIRQLISKKGITSDMGGQHVSSIKRKILSRCVKEKISSKNKEFRIKRNYGCSVKEYEDIMGGVSFVVNVRCPAFAYTQQKHNAIRRGILFRLSFPQWYKLWKDSDCFKHRGIGKGSFCMSRFGDAGAYEIGNVEILYSPQNNSDAWKYKQWDAWGNRRIQDKKT